MVLHGLGMTIIYMNTVSRNCKETVELTLKEFQNCSHQSCLHTCYKMASISKKNIIINILFCLMSLCSCQLHFYV